MKSDNPPITSLPVPGVWARKKGTTGSPLPCTLIEVRRYVPDPAVNFFGTHGGPSTSLLLPSQMLAMEGAGSNGGNGHVPAAYPQQQQQQQPYLVGFVVWTGGSDRRNNVWLPVADIFTSSAGTTSINVSKPLIDDKLREPIPFGERVKLWPRDDANEIPFLEERLRRDIEIPPIVRFVHYVDHTMPAWYFSPLHVKLAEYSTSKAAMMAHKICVSTTTTATGAVATAVSTSQGGGNNASLVRNSYEELYDAHVCPFSLRIFRSHEELVRNWMQMRDRRIPGHPPGEVVYRDEANGLTLYRVCGVAQPSFCTNMLLLARCFLQNKLCGHEPGLYTFYVLTLDWDQIFSSDDDDDDDDDHDQRKGDDDDAVPGAQRTKRSDVKRGERFFAGYYSVERGESKYNLACIVVLPCFQGRGLGRLLISLSYKIALAGINQGTRPGELAAPVTTAEAVRDRRDAQTALRRKIARSSSSSNRAALLEQLPRPGTPERPLSDLGDAMYKQYWDQKVWAWVAKQSAEISRANAISINSTPALPARRKAAKAGAASRSDAAPEGGPAQIMSMEEIAEQVEIETDDLCSTLVRLGLVHKTESKSLKLLLPHTYATWAADKAARAKNGMVDAYCKF